MSRVLITDSLSSVALESLAAHGLEADIQLKRTPAELTALASEVEAWLIRSGTQITDELLAAAPNLRIIGRAGVGVDNVDLEAATRRGVVVVNAPDGNTISTAEHTCAMILALMRHIPQAAASLRAGSWERKAFEGAEVEGKTLGVIGVGKIGRCVAERMAAFGMRLVGFDPVLAPDQAERMGMRLMSLEKLLGEADVITVHTPLNDATRGLIDHAALAKCKRGVRIINIARGGIVDEAALLQALESGHVAGAALDVYSSEPPPEHLRPLIEHPAVVATPHIAASTDEAQEKVALHVIDQVARALAGEAVTSAVNARAISLSAQPEAQPFLTLGDRLGKLAGQLITEPVRRVIISLSGEGPVHYGDVVVASVLKGLMGLFSDEPVNLVNAGVIAREHGLRVEERREEEGDNFASLISVTLEGDGVSRTVRGALFTMGDGRHEGRLVGLDEFRFEVRLEGHLLFYRNVDRPGMLASVGGLLADAGINIGGLALGRTEPGATAQTAIATDGPLPDEILEQVRSVHGVEDVRVATV
ncbi:phosphoglycerate dehydrogenase [soil metagenome]